jgi:hypothetical protein
MIQDVDETIRNLLLKRGKIDDSAVDISFDQPTGEWAGSLTRPTINCYLYDIRENVELRSRDFKIERDINNGMTRRVFDPLRVDLSYIITSWTRNIRDEHALLSRVLTTCAAVRAIRPSDAEIVEEALRNQPLDMPVKVALPSEAIRNLPDLWGVMENQLRPAINFVITIAVDLNEVITAPMVLTAQFDFGPYQPNGARSLKSYRQTETAKIDQAFHVGGTVFLGDQPLPDATIRMVDHPFEVLTDSAGRYVFASVPRGDYALTIEHPSAKKPLKAHISVPSEKYDLKVK